MSASTVQRLSADDTTPHYVPSDQWTLGINDGYFQVVPLKVSGGEAISMARRAGLTVDDHGFVLK